MTVSGTQLEAPGGKAASERISSAIALARSCGDESIATLAEFVRVGSLTGEEWDAQAWISEKLKAAGARVELCEPDVEALFAAYPEIAQYPTHWQHDLILPYEVLPTYEALRASGLEDRLNYHRRPNVTGHFPGSGGGRSLILNGHADTVAVGPPDEWSREPFGAEIVDGLLYGRGSSDMKGGVIAAYMALDFLRRAGVQLKGDVIFQSVVNEEHAGNGTLDLVRRGLVADAAIVLEPTENRVAIDHPGGLYWEVTIQGVARSPGARWRAGRIEGVSAIEKLPEVIEALRAIEARYAGMPTKDGRDPFALVIGKVSGGTYETVTASSVSLRGAAYFSAEAGDIASVMQDFRDAIAQVNARDDFLRDRPARLEFLHHDDGTLQAADIEPLRVMRERLARDGVSDEIMPGPFCCDLRHLVNQGGIPSLIFGPGTITQAHRPDEHIRLDQYLDSIVHLIGFIADWCGVDEA